VLWDVTLIQWLQGFRSPVLDQLALALTWLGDELFYMLAIPVLYWASRERTHRLAVVVLVTLWLNGAAKEWAAMPRPDPALGIAQLYEARGPGFPSGHAQGSLTFWGWLALEYPRPWFVALAVLMILGISGSRLYLGVHYPGDLLGGWALGLVVILVAAMVMGRDRRRDERGPWRWLLAVLVPLLMFPFSPSSSTERAVGFLIGLLTGDRVALRAIPYGGQASPLQHLIRSTLGVVGFFGLALLVRTYAAPGLPAVFGYALVAVWVTVVAPLLFLRTGLASPPLEVQWRVRQRRIPSLAAPSPLAVGTYLGVSALVALGVVGASWAASRLPTGDAPASLWATEIGPRNIAHRGASGLAPENTLPAFEEAVRHGADWIELDVHETSDGQVVVIHDDRVDRTTDGQGEVARLTLTELKALDAGYRMSPDGVSFPFRGQGVTIPTLEEVLTALPSSRFIVEMKPGDPSFAARVLEVVDRAGARDRVLLAGFDDDVVRRARELAPDVLTSMGQGEALRMQIMLRMGLGAFWRPPADVAQLPERYQGLPVVTEALIRLAHRKGVPVHVWTVNEASEMRRLAALGVDGIITDYPDRMASVLAERASRLGSGREEGAAVVD